MDSIKPDPIFRFLSAEEGGPDMWFPNADNMTIRTATEEELDSIARELIPRLDRVIEMADEVHGEDPPYVFEDQPESKPDYKPPKFEALGFTKDSDTGGFFTSPGEEHLQLAIQGQAVMDISTLEPLRDGSYRIVLSSKENWGLKSVLMSGLDSSMEIELILVPTI
jgi:hypothetical protein